MSSSVEKWALIVALTPQLRRLANTLKFRMLSRFCYDAQDLYQDTMLRAWNNLDKWEDDGKPDAMFRWLQSMMRNHALNVIVRHKHQAFSLDSLVVADTLVPRIRPDEDWAVRDELQHRLSNLPASLVECMELRTQECTYEEIVEQTGVPIGTVKSRLNRARALMWPRKKTGACFAAFLV